MISALRLFILILATLWGVNAVSAEEQAVECPKDKPKIPDMKRSDVYKGKPYSAGELAEFEVKYMGALAGTGVMEVRNPRKMDGRWYRSFHAEGKTGDWYKYFFVGHDLIDAVVQPWDGAIYNFYMKQDEGKLLGKRLHQETWLEFDHQKCKVKVRKKKKKAQKREEQHLRLILRSARYPWNCLLAA